MIEKQMKKKMAVAIGIGVFIAILAFAYSTLISATKIGLVNYKDYQVARFLRANDNSWISIDKLDKSAINQFSDYDVIYIFGRGLSLTPEQVNALKAAGSQGTKLMVISSTNYQVDVTNINSAELLQLNDYLHYGGEFNYQQLLHYSRIVLDNKSFAVEAALPAKEIAEDVLFHLDESKTFTTVNDYLTYYKTLPSYHANGKKIALLASVPGPFNSNRDHLEHLINELEQAGMQVYPVSSFKKRLDFIKQIKPDIVLMMPHGLMQRGREQTVDYLKSINVPLLAPLSVFELYNKWLDDPQGYNPSLLTMNIVLPELDGAIVPYVINAQFKDKNNLDIFKSIPQRTTHFITLIKKWLCLKDNENATKKLAIVYFKGPGKNALVAGNMEVMPSLFNSLHNLKKQGYDLGDLPNDYQQFKAAVNRQGAVMTPYAQGQLDNFFKTANPALIDANTYNDWCHNQLAEGLCAKVENLYGKAPGEFMTTSNNGQQYIAVARLTFGNIVLLPQPMPGIGDDTFKLVHGTQKAPPHSYLATYMWIKDIFHADAIMHFGTHGSLEFTEGKQVGLSQYDWADALIGQTPHFYVYTMSNVGEAIIAKRRSYATILSHLTPPFDESGLYSDIKQLADRVDEFKLSKGGNQVELKTIINNYITKLDLNQDLQLPPELLALPLAQWQNQVLQPLSKWLETIAQAKITKGLYTLGKSYSREKAEKTATLMALDPLIQSYMSLQQQQGHHVNEADIRVQAKEWISRLFHGEDSAKLITQLLGPTIINRSHSLQTANKNTPQTEVIKTQHLDKKLAKNLSKTSADEQQLAESVTLFTTALTNVVNYRTHLLAGTTNEFNAINNALAGGYTEPSSGGDPVVNPAALPTGRNMFSIDADKTPSVAAWNIGKKLAENLLTTHLEETGHYPEKVSFSLWSSSFISSHGTTIAEILYLLGVEPVRDPFKRVKNLKLIPEEELGRPRIDVVVQSSGQLRDLASTRLALIEKAVKMAANADKGGQPNYVAKGVQDAEQYLLDQGVAPLTARTNAYRRSFGGLNGNYGTAIMSQVEQGESWQHDADIAKQYLTNMGAVYGDGDSWGDYTPHLFAAALQNTEIVIQPRSSNTWGALSLDHVYEFMGGLNLAVRQVTGKDPAAYFNDYRNPNKAKLTSLNETIWTEMRTTLLNPKYISALMEGEASSAETFAETFRNTFGWNVMKPSAIDDSIWNNLYKVYVEDSLQLNVKDFFKQQNPYALQEMTGVMLETAHKGLWQATDEQLETLATLHAELVNQYEAGCGDFTCGNLALEGFIKAQLNDPSLSASYQQAIDNAQVGTSQSEGVVMTKQESKPQPKAKEQPQDKSSTNENNANNAADNSIWWWLLLLLPLLLLLTKRKSHAH